MATQSKRSKWAEFADLAICTVGVYGCYLKYARLQETMWGQRHAGRG